MLRPPGYRDDERVDVGEIHLFAGDEYVMPVRHAESPDLAKVSRRMVDEFEPVVTGLENDIDEIEDDLFGADPDVSRAFYILLGAEPSAASSSASSPATPSGT